MEVTVACSRGGGLRPCRQLLSLCPGLTLPVPLSPPVSVPTGEAPPPRGTPPPHLGLRGTPLWRLAPRVLPTSKELALGGVGGLLEENASLAVPAPSCGLPLARGRDGKSKRGAGRRKVEERGHRQAPEWGAMVKWRWERALLGAGAPAAD